MLSHHQRTVATYLRKLPRLQERTVTVSWFCDCGMCLLSLSHPLAHTEGCHFLFRSRLSGQATPCFFCSATWCEVRTGGLQADRYAQDDLGQVTLPLCIFCFSADGRDVDPPSEVFVELSAVTHTKWWHTVGV